MRGRIILILFTMFGITATTLSMKKQSLKDLILVYLLKCTVASFTDQIVVNKGLLKYPVRLFPNSFKTSVLFDYLMFPWGCVAYYKLTKDTSVLNWLVKLVLFIVPMSLIELILLKKTKLIEFKKWSITTTIITEAIACLGIRSFMELINKFNEKDLSV